MMDATIDATAPAALERLPSLAPGTVIAGQYVIEAQIGEGGMGEVYRAKQQNLGRLVALKLLRRDSCNTELERRRLVREARVASALCHPNAVKIYDVGHDGPNTFIVMELISGSLLSAMLEEGLVESGVALEMIEQIADVLVAAHSICMVHRDLKPANLFVEYEGEGRLRVRVVDFGLAFIGGEQPSERLTARGTMVGTPAYLSPEQAKGEVVGPPADVYSLGCVAYELLTGHRVFVGSNINVLTQQIYVTPVAPSERAPTAGISPELDALVLRMLAKQPDHRPTATELLEQLQGHGEPRRSPEVRARPLSGRAARMVSVPAAPRPNLDEDAVRAATGRDGGGGGECLRVGIMGPLDDGLYMGIVSNGMAPRRLGPGEDPGGVDVLLTTEPRPAELSALVATGVPVVAMGTGARASGLTELLRLGVREVIGRSYEVDSLVRKLRRAVRRGRRPRARRAGAV